jgi:hypothetical protein
LSVEIAGERLAGVVDDRELPGQPYDLAALGDNRLRVAALLRTFALSDFAADITYCAEFICRSSRGLGCRRAPLFSLKAAIWQFDGRDVYVGCSGFASSPEGIRWLAGLPWG